MMGPYEYFGIGIIVWLLSTAILSFIPPLTTVDMFMSKNFLMILGLGAAALFLWPLMAFLLIFFWITYAIVGIVLLLRIWIGR